MELQSMKSRSWFSKEKKECDIKRDHLKALKQDNWLVNFMKLVFLLRSAWPLIQILPISTLSLSSFLYWDPTLYLLFNLLFLFFIFRLLSLFLLQHENLVCFSEYHTIFMLLGILLSKITEDPSFSCVRLLHLRLVLWIFCLFLLSLSVWKPCKKRFSFVKKRAIQIYWTMAGR